MVSKRVVFIKKKPHVRNFSARNSRAGNGYANFMGAWEFWVPSAENLHAQKFFVLWAGGVGFGRGEYTRETIYYLHRLGKWVECCFDKTVCEEKIHWVFVRTRRAQRKKTRWVCFGTQVIGWEKLAELFPRNSMRTKNLTAPQKNPWRSLTSHKHLPIWDDGPSIAFQFLEQGVELSAPKSPEDPKLTNLFVRFLF